MHRLVIMRLAVVCFIAMGMCTSASAVDKPAYVLPKPTLRRNTTTFFLRGEADKACTCDNGLKAPCGAACCDDGESYCDPGYGCCGPNCHPDGSQCCSNNDYCEAGYDCCGIATQGIVCVPVGTCGTPTVQPETVHQVGEIIGKICGPLGCIGGV